MPFGLLNYRHLFQVAVVALLVFALYGCSSSDTNDTDGPDDAPAESEDAGLNPENPHPAGGTVEIDGWELKFSGLREDVTEEIVMADPYAVAPQPGFQFAMYSVDATYTGSGSSSLWEQFTFGIWSDDAFYLQCPASVPNDLYFTPEVSAGGTVSGNLCAEIPAGATNLVAYIETLVSDDPNATSEPDRTFFALAEGEPEEAPTDGTSSKAPLPAGATVTIGDWSVTAKNLRIDAFEEVAEHNSEDSVPEGYQLALYDVEGTYSGPDNAALAFEVNVGVWAEGSLYEEGCLAYVPDYIADAPNVENGGTVSATACAEVSDDIADTADLLFYITMPETSLAPMYFVEPE